MRGEDHAHVDQLLALEAGRDVVADREVHLAAHQRFGRAGQHRLVQLDARVRALAPEALE
jgi:hypothetical protein